MIEQIPLDDKAVDGPRNFNSHIRSLKLLAELQSTSLLFYFLRTERGKEIE